ncbi:MAG: hypothetical protein RMJ53_08050 [Chitinophagales bacterium]|nr:hypothetical protein [Chitinophagales bacterium]MDW8274164.1 hypothetical protein [Chitinophagales bacterium]
MRKIATPLFIALMLALLSSFAKSGQRVQQQKAYEAVWLQRV